MEEEGHGGVAESTRKGETVKPERVENRRWCARQMGAEYQANPGSSRGEYLASAAFYYGKETFAELSKEDRDDLLSGFNEGIRAEKALQ